MTVLIGLRCSDGAVFACDSQETRGTYFRFWPKVSVLENRFAVLGAGNSTTIEAFARRLDIGFGDAAKQGQIDRSRASQIIEEILISLAKEGGDDVVKGRQILITGISDDNEICLWAVDAGEMYLRNMHTWECYGSGIDAAEMLMKDFYFPEVSTKEAVPLLAYVIQAVSEVCLDCGGPISIVVIDGQALKELPSEEVEAVINKVKPWLDRLRKELPKEVLKGKLANDRLMR